MADKSPTDRADDILLKLTGTSAKWSKSVALPYTRAYVVAYKNYQEKMKEQKDQTQSRVEMFILVASLLGGTTLMYAFGASSLRVLGASALLNFVCSHNLERIFNFMAWTVNKAPLMFAVGGLLEKAGEKISEAGKKKISDAFAGNPQMIQESDPLIYHTYVLGFLDRAVDAVTEAAMEVRNNRSMSEMEKQRLVEELENARFNHPPAEGVVDELHLAERMELSFYLTSIINSATLSTATFTNDQAFIMWRKSPINTLPSDPAYPKSSFRYPDYRGEVVVNTQVKIASLGSLIRQRVDELHRRFLGATFYRDEGIEGQLSYVTSREDLIRAQRGLERLADATMPTF